MSANIVSVDEESLRNDIKNLVRKTVALIINFIRTLPTFIRTCADECGNPIP